MTGPAVLTQNPKATLAATLVSVFLCGAVAGALAMTFGGLHSHRPAMVDPGPSRAHELERWRRELNLSDEQTNQLETILDDFSKYYDNVMGDAKSRVLLLLNDDQKLKFERMMKNSKR